MYTRFFKRVLSYTHMNSERWQHLSNPLPQHQARHGGTDIHPSTPSRRLPHSRQTAGHGRVSPVRQACPCR